MNEGSPLSVAGKLEVAGLLAAAARIPTRALAGVDYPTIPPGLVILMVATGLVIPGTRWRGTPIVGVIVGLFIAVGGVLAAPG